MEAVTDALDKQCHACNERDARTDFDRCFGLTRIAMQHAALELSLQRAFQLLAVSSDLSPDNFVEHDNRVPVRLKGGDDRDLSCAGVLVNEAQAVVLDKTILVIRPLSTAGTAG